MEKLGVSGLCRMLLGSPEDMMLATDIIKVSNFKHYTKDERKQLCQAIIRSLIRIKDLRMEAFRCRIKTTIDWTDRVESLKDSFVRIYKKLDIKLIFDIIEL